MTTDESTALRPPTSETLDGLAAQVRAVASAVSAPMGASAKHWLELTKCFHVDGAENAQMMLHPIASSVARWCGALSWLAQKLQDKKGRFDELRKNATKLEEQLQLANTLSYNVWNRWETSTRYHSADETSNTQLRDDMRRGADDQVHFARANIAKHNQEVRDAERELANDLIGIDGGTRVYDLLGEVTTSQTHWGYVHSPYPGAPLSAQTVVSLATYMSDRIARGAQTRVRKLAAMSPEEAQKWLSQHPDFLSTVTFIPPADAARLYTDLSSRSWPHDAVPPDSGPLATLFAVAPAAIGGLNGIPASVKNTFNRKALGDLLASGTLKPDQRKKLESVKDRIEKPVKLPDDSEAPVQLLSVFLDDDGTPRASIGYGDIDAANQIVTTTHGIETDLGGIKDWDGLARDLYAQTKRQTEIAGTGKNSAVVLFMEWDSGAWFNVGGIERPNAGAERLNALVGGFEFRRPETTQELVAHSLGTTMATQAVVNAPRLWDSVNLLGSAGITELSAEKLKEIIKTGEVQVYATHASKDHIAPLGRNETLVNSKHSVDPRTILDGAHVFSSDGGFVAGYGDRGGEVGVGTEGHNIRVDTKTISGHTRAGRTTTRYVPSPGYLDPNSEAFMHVVMNLVESQRVNAP